MLDIQVRPTLLHAFTQATALAAKFAAGWSSPVARQAHNLKVIGSNPIPATKHMESPLAVATRAFSFAVSQPVFGHCGAL